MLQLLPRARCASFLELSSSKDQLMQIHAQMIINALLRDAPNVSKLMEKYQAEASKDSNSHARLLLQQAAEATKDPYLWNAMLKSASPEESLSLFSRMMLTAATPNHTTYACVLRSCAIMRAVREGKQVHATVLKSGLDSQLALATTCTHFYALCRDTEAARQLFDAMTERTSVSWNAMLTGYCTNGLAKEALLLFKEMGHSEALPTDRTTLLLLSACSQLGDLALGATVHSLVLKTNPAPLDCPFTGTALIDMYSKCGSLGSACALFESMRRRNVIVWSAMAAAFAVHGRGKEVIELINKMEREGRRPNAITVTSLLSACCHAGLIEEGLHLFDEMQRRFNVAPTMQHYGCIIDLLGRAGMVKEAHEFAESMPVKPDAVVWRTLLSACMIHGEAEIGERVGKILIRLEQKPTDCEDFVALSNMYASSEKWDEVCVVRTTMKKRRMQNKAGWAAVHNIQARLELQTSIEH